MKEKIELIPSDKLWQIVKKEVDDLILYFSCGKDSIAMWLYLRDKGFNILPVYLYTVPGLRSDAENLAYYEDYFGCHILRMPHPLLYEMLNNLVYQPPERVAQILAFDLPKFKFSDIDAALAYSYLNNRPYYSAMGMRSKDNMDRRMMMYQNGVLGKKKRKYYYAIWDWDVNQVAEIINENNVKLPKVYEFSGRTIAAIDYYYMQPFREEYPDDYKIFLEWFPLLDSDAYRYEVLNG